MGHPGARGCGSRVWGSAVSPFHCLPWGYHCPCPGEEVWESSHGGLRLHARPLAASWPEVGGPVEAALRLYSRQHPQEHQSLYLFQARPRVGGSGRWVGGSRWGVVGSGLGAAGGGAVDGGPGLGGPTCRHGGARQAACRLGVSHSAWTPECVHGAAGRDEPGGPGLWVGSGRWVFLPWGGGGGSCPGGLPPGLAPRGSLGWCLWVSAHGMLAG